jgi:integrase
MVTKAEAIRAATEALKSAGFAEGKIKAALRSLGIVEETKATKAKALTNAIQVMNAPIGVHRIGNATGLYLKKSGVDTGSYLFRYRFGKKRRSMGLGPISGPTAITLAEARDKAGELARLRKTSDPIEARKAARKASIDAAKAEAAAAKKRVTFAEAASTYLDTNGPKWKHPGARASWRNMVNRYALPALGDMSLNDIEAAHVAAAMDAAGTPVMAKKIRVAIEQVIRAGIALGQRDAKKGNPADRKVVALLTKVGKRQTEHYRRIDLHEAPTIFRRLKQLAVNPPRDPTVRGPVPMIRTALAAWIFMIATAARPSEALGAKWSEIDFERGLWTLPAERAKGGRGHVTPLSSTAMWALELMQAKRVGECDTVFPGRGSAPLAGSSFSDVTRKIGVDAGAPHSWRSVFRDWAGDIGRIDRDLAEAQLAHSLGGVEGAYRRQSAIEARRGPMEAYARWLTCEGASVVPFQAKAS